MMKGLSPSKSKQDVIFEKDLVLERIPDTVDGSIKENDGGISKLKEAEKKIFDGKTAFLIEDSFSAIENYNAALRILKELGIGYEAKILEILHEIVENCMKSEHDNLVIEYSDKLKFEAENAGDLFHMGNADYFKGKIILKKENIDEGLKTLQNASILFEKALDFAGVGKVNREIADQYLGKKKYDSASLFFIETIKNYQKAILKFHPKRKSVWALPQNLRKSIVDLKEIVQNLLTKIEDKDLLKKINEELKVL